MVLGKLDSYMKKNEIRILPDSFQYLAKPIQYCKIKKKEYFLTPYTILNSKGTKDLNVRTETVKLLEENIGRRLDDITQREILFDLPPRVMKIKTKVNTWDLIKVKSFCTTKETISKVKRQPSEWKKIITNETTTKD